MQFWLRTYCLALIGIRSTGSFQQFHFRGLQLLPLMIQVLKTQILSQFNVRLKSDVCLLFQGEMVKPSALGRRYLFIYFGGVDGVLFFIFYFFIIIYNELCFWICHSGLAEAGVIPSKLSNKNSSDNNSDNQGHIYFFPERYDMCSTFSNSL